MDAVTLDTDPIEHGTVLDITKPANPPASDPAHPAHHAWVARVVNALLETGVLVLTGGRVQVGPPQT